MKKKKGRTIFLILSVAIISFYLGNKIDFAELKNKSSILNKKALAVYLEGDDGEYVLSSSNKFPTEGYALNLEKSTCTNGGKLSQNAETKAINMSTSNKSECNLYFEKEKDEPATTVLFAKANDSSITDYNLGNKGEMFVFNHPAKTQIEALTDYRYIGSNPNNYIDFNDETWRIIGVFTVETESGSKEQLIKIIRDETIGNLAWDSSNVNEWSTASLKTLLNGDYYTQTGSYTSTSIVKGLSSTARAQVANVKWYLGGSSTYSGLGGPNYYAFERETTVYSGRSTNIIAKVGLMYPSDYIYTYANGVDNICYTNGYSCMDSRGGTPANGWLFKSGTPQWMLSPSSSGASNAFDVSSRGDVSNFSVYSSNTVRPTVFLASDVAIVGGDGSSSNHYKLAD